MTDITWIQPSFPNTWDYIEDDIDIVAPELRDATLHDFVRNISTALALINDTYVPK